MNGMPLPGAGASLVIFVGLVLSVGPLPSDELPSAPGVVRINLEVIEDMPVTAQPAQLEEAPAGWAQDATSFSTGQKIKILNKAHIGISEKNERNWPNHSVPIISVAEI